MLEQIKDDGNGNEDKKVKMKSGSELGSDEKVKSAESKKKCEMKRESLWIPGYMEITFLNSNLPKKPL